MLPAVEVALNGAELQARQVVVLQQRGVHEGGGSGGGAAMGQRERACGA